MNETELERMVVRLVGDATSYLETLQRAQTATTASADSIEREFVRIRDGLQQQIGQFGMSGREVEDYKLRMSGLSQSQQTQIQGFRNELRGLQDTSAARKQAAMVAADSQRNAEAQIAASRQQGINITRSVMTVEERRKEHVDGLNKLLKEGHITQDTFNRSLKSVTPVVQQAASRFQQLGSQVKTLGTSLLGTLAGFGLVASLKGALGKFTDMERQQVRLKAAIQASGEAVDPTMARYLKFASQMANVTLVTKDTTMKMLEQAQTMGFTGEAAEQVVRNAIAMAKGNGEEAQSYVRVASMMQRGNLEVARRILGLQGVTEHSKLVVAVQDRLKSSWAQAIADANTTGGKIEKLGRSFSELTKEIGGLIAGAITPLLDGLKKLVDWFKSLDPIVRKTVALITLLLTTITSFSLIWSTIQPIVAIITTVIGLLFSEWLIPIGLVIGAVVALVNYLGGLQSTWDTVKTAGATAWEYLKQKASEFIEWIRPITLALVSLFKTAWTMIQDGAIWLWQQLVSIFNTFKSFLVDLWHRVMGDVHITWNDIRDFIRDAIIAAEFFLLHFKDIAEYAWTGTKLGFVKLGNQIEYFFRVVIPTILIWFKNNWVAIFLATFRWTTSAMLTLGINIVTIFKNIPWSSLWTGFKLSLQVVIANTVGIFKSLPRLIIGAATFSGLWKDEGKKAGKDLSDGLKEIPKEVTTGVQPLVLPEREIGELERRLQEEFEKQGGALRQSFEEFRRLKLEEFAATGNAAAQAIIDQGKLDPFKGIGDSAKKAAHEVSKFDAALVNSVEGIVRLQEYQLSLGDSFRPFTSSRSLFNSPPSNRPLRAREAPTPQSIRERGVDSIAVEVLREIRDLLKEDSKKPGIDIKAAGLA